MTLTQEEEARPSGPVLVIRDASDRGATFAGRAFFLVVVVFIVGDFVSEGLNWLLLIFAAMAVWAFWMWMTGIHTQRHPPLPLLRLDRDGVTTAVASVRWADLDRVELDEWGEGNLDTIFVLREGAMPGPGSSAYRATKTWLRPPAAGSPRLTRRGLEVKNWGDGTSIATFFTGPIVSTKVYSALTAKVRSLGRRYFD